MSNLRIRILLPLLLIAFVLIYCWFVLLTSNYIPSWKHYFAIGLYVIILFLLFRNLAYAIIGTGIYLILATIHVISLSAVQNTFQITILNVNAPGIQLMALGLFIVYAFLNLDAVIDIYLNYKSGDFKNNF